MPGPYTTFNSGNLPVTGQPGASRLSVYLQDSRKLPVFQYYTSRTIQEQSFRLSLSPQVSRVLLSTHISPLTEVKHTCSADINSPLLRHIYLTRDGAPTGHPYAVSKAFRCVLDLNGSLGINQYPCLYANMGDYPFSIILALILGWV